MNIEQFKKKAVVTTFNTNNGWGFGGSVGKLYTYKGLTLKEGKWCYRHTKGESFVLFFTNGSPLIRKDFEELISNLE